ncbi:ATP-binding protein [Halobellus captivus]|uniref:ATP-binding protein n=1 Tax=Halobellus captivus TaxID=2592614 RepID=UPI0011A02953|nr:ATP-binding protein [Halobellus captivus]
MSGENVTTEEAKRKLYDRIRSDTSFDEKAEDVLEVGREYLDVDNSHLTRIDRELDHWEAIVSTDSPDGRFPPGLEIDLGTTYCRRTINADSAIALYDAPNQGWADDPAFETHGLRCYHGTTLVLDEEPYGTVCFVSEESREEPFSPGETWFIELLTRLLERELERRQHQAQLTRQANLAMVLNRVLRHNLRNDISVIRGFTQVMADKLEGDSESEPVLRKIDRLIALSEKARELDRIVATDFQPEPIEVVTLVERVADEVTREFPAATISTEHDEEITADVLPSFERALEELIENAGKHAGDDPTVTVAVERVPNAIEIRVADDGPGLADHEAEVFETGEETPLTHGSGLGLWLAHWIVTSHDGSVDAAATEDGTTITVTIPQKLTTNAQERLTKLTRARDQYQAAFEDACDAMLLVNDEARIIDANAEAARLFGPERSALLGRSVSEFLPGELDFETMWTQSHKHGAERDTVTIIDADGESRSVEYSVTADIVPDQHLLIGREDQ